MKSDIEKEIKNIKKKLKKEVKTLYFKINKNFWAELMKDFNDFEKMFKHLKTIDVNNIKPMTRIDDTPISSLRNDIPEKSFDHTSFLKNVPVTKDNYVVIDNLGNNDQT